MAWVDTDELGDTFVNLHGRVGTTGDKNDVLAVQAMLDLVFSKMPALKQANHGKRVTVDGRPSAELARLIAIFQKLIVKQNRPAGYINSAVAAKRSGYTIWQLNATAGLTIAASGQFQSLVHYLRTAYPGLSNLVDLSTPTNIRDEPSPQRERPIGW